MAARPIAASSARCGSYPAASSAGPRNRWICGSSSMTRMRGRWADIERALQQQLVGGRGLGQADQDARASTVEDRAGRRDAPAHRLDEAFGDRESEAGAFVAFA